MTCDIMPDQIINAAMTAGLFLTLEQASYLRHKIASNKGDCGDRQSVRYHDMASANCGPWVVSWDDLANVRVQKEEVK